MLLSVLLRFSAKILIADFFHLSQARVVRLHVPKTDAVIHMPKAAVLNWRLGSSPCLSVGFSLHNEAMGVARSEPQEDHYYADVVHVLPSS